MRPPVEALHRAYVLECMHLQVLLCLLGPVLVVPFDRLFGVTMEVVSASVSQRQIPVHFLYRASKVFSDSALCFVDFPCYEQKLAVTRRTFGESGGRRSASPARQTKCVCLRSSLSLLLVLVKTKTDSMIGTLWQQDAMLASCVFRICHF